MAHHDGEKPTIIDAEEVEHRGVPVEPLAVEEPVRQPSAPDIQFNRRKPVVIRGLLITLAVVFVAQCIVGFITWNWLSDMGDKWAHVGDWAAAPFVLVYMGAKNSALIAQYNEFWRLLTCVFLHGDIIHLLMNGFGLYIWGRYIELLFGRGKTLFLFLVSGIGGSLLSYALSPSWSLGASGALFGLFGTLLYFRKRRPDIFRQAFGPQVIVLIVINVVYGFSTSGIDNYGHLGGLIAGYLGAWAVGLYKEKAKAWWAWPAMGVFAAVCLAVGALRWGVGA